MRKEGVEDLLMMSRQKFQVWEAAIEKFEGDRGGRVRGEVYKFSNIRLRAIELNLHLYFCGERCKGGEGRGDLRVGWAAQRGRCVR